MSWSRNVVGTPAAIKQDFDRYKESLCGESLVEFQAAKPHLSALVDLNSNQAGPCTLKLAASGHGTFRTREDGVRETVYSNCMVEISSVPFALVVEENPLPPG